MTVVTHLNRDAERPPRDGASRTRTGDSRTRDGDSRGRAAVLAVIKRHGPSPAGEVATALHISDIAVRQHLHALAAEGLVDFEEESRGRGRPTKVWRLTGVSNGQFADTHADLSIDLLEAARASLGDAAVQTLLDYRVRDTVARYAQSMPSDTSVCRRVKKLAELRSAEGYMAEVVREARGVFLLIENHCPISDAAARCSGLCGSELAIFELVMGAGIHVERCEHIGGGGQRCVYRMRRLDASVLPAVAG